MSTTPLDDDDAPELTEALMRQAIPLQQALPDLYEALLRQRGRPKVVNPKVNATLRAHMPETQA